MINARTVARHPLVVVSGRRARHFGSALSACALAVVVLAISSMATISTADAAAYRYWSYWNSTDAGSWSFASGGAGGHRPADGTVEGWRFAVSEGVTSSKRPRMDASFDAICGATSHGDGQKRVGLVVDYGTAADAPPGDSRPGGVTFTCVVVAEKATGAAVLSAALGIRSKSGLVCGINGYPRTECAAVVAAPRPTTPASPSTGPKKPTASDTGDTDGGGSTSPTSSTGTSRGAAAAPQKNAVAGDANSTTSPSVTTDNDATASPSSGDAPSAEGASPATTPQPTPAPSANSDEEAVVGVDAAEEITATSNAGSAGSPLGVLVTLAVLGLAGAAVFAVRKRASGTS